jgi:non-specific serine/threonine protein kinase
LDVLDDLTSLTEKSLLRQQEDAQGEPRLVMLETIREYGLERLVASGEEAAVRRAHADCYAAFATHAELHAPTRGALTRQLKADDANLRAALSYSGATADGGERLLRLAAALGDFWFFLGRTSEGRAWCEAALARPEAAAHPALRARVLFSAGQNAWDRDDLPAARSLLEASAAGARAAGDSRCLLRALHALGEVLWALDDPDGASAVTDDLAACAGTVGDTWERGLTLERLGMQAFGLGDLAAARACFEQSLAQLRRMKDPYMAAYVVRNLGYVAQAEGRYEEALQHMTESVTINQEIDDLRGVAAALAALAGLAVAQGQPALAAQLSGAAAATLERTGAAALHPRDRAVHERTFAAERAALDAATFDAMHAEGRVLSVDAALTLASTCLGWAAVGADAP